MAEAVATSNTQPAASPLAFRLATGLSAPGGRRLSAETLRGAGVTIRDRVVHLAPGLSSTVRRVLDASPQTYTAVEPDALARAALAGCGGALVDAPLDATGLSEGCATVVLAEGALWGLADAVVAATLAEASRLLCPRGRLVVHEVAGTRPALLPGAAARSPKAWREAIEAAGLVVAGSTEGPLEASDPWMPVFRAGPRVGPRLGHALARELLPRGAGAAVRHLRTSPTDSLGAVVILAEKPVIMGMTWSGGS